MDATSLLNDNFGFINNNIINWYLWIQKQQKCNVIFIASTILLNDNYGTTTTTMKLLSDIKSLSNNI